LLKGEVGPKPGGNRYPGHRSQSAKNKETGKTFGTAGRQKLRRNYGRGGLKKIPFKAFLKRIGSGGSALDENSDVHFRMGFKNSGRQRVKGSGVWGGVLTGWRGGTDNLTLPFEENDSKIGQ